MNQRLVVQQFEGTEVGTIHQAEDGSLVVEGTTPAHGAALQELINRIIGTPLSYRTGNDVTSQQGITHIELAKKVAPSDPDYLLALSDELPNHTLLGQRIHGYVM